MADDIFTQETVDKLNASALTFNEVVTSRAGGVASGAIIDQTLTPLGEATDTLKGRLDKIGIIYTDWGSAIGGTLTTPAQAFLNNTVGSDGFGNYYSWSGVYPSGGHVVAPGTDPAAVGSGYTPRTDVVLRTELTSMGATIDEIASAIPALRYATPDDIYDVLIVYGQSNAVGYAENAVGRSSDITDLGKYWNGTSLQPLIYNMTQSSGDVSTGNAWVPFANEYCRITGRKLVIIPCAKGATSIADLQKGGTYYTAMAGWVSSFNSYASSSGISIGKRFIAFHQGEADQLNGTTTAAYSAGLSQLHADVMADFGLDFFIIHLVGYPQNRLQSSWDYIRNVQMSLVRTHGDVLCGFDMCSSFSKANGLLGSDGVHYSQRGYNMMGQESARVAASVVNNDKPADLVGGGFFNTKKFPNDRNWFELSGSVGYVTDAWKLKTRDNSSGTPYGVASNILSIDASSNLQIKIIPAFTCVELLEFPVAHTPVGMAEIGFTYKAFWDSANSAVLLRCYADLQFMVKTDGTICSHTGNALSSIVSQFISASYNATSQQWTVTIQGDMMAAAATVTPYGAGSNARLIVGSGTTLTVSAPSADTNKSFVVSVNNVRLYFTSKTNLDPIPFRMVGGNKID